VLLETDRLNDEPTLPSTAAFAIRARLVNLARRLCAVVHHYDVRHPLGFHFRRTARSSLLLLARETSIGKLLLHTTLSRSRPACHRKPLQLLQKTDAHCEPAANWGYGAVGGQIERPIKRTCRRNSH
jgi:hypothetical protein